MNVIRAMIATKKRKPLPYVIMRNIILWGAVLTVWGVAAVVMLGKGHLDLDNKMTTEESFRLLDQSVVEYTFARGVTMCTATMIAPGTYISAAHCAKERTKTYIVNSELDFVTVDRVDVSATSDWMIIYTKEDLPGVVPIAVGCSTEHWYIGMPVAYLGYPAPLVRYYSEGIVVSIENYRGYDDDDPFNLALTSLHGGPGASGSGIINMETGELIAVLSTGISSSRGNLMGVGITSIYDIPQCGLPDGGIRG